MTVFDQYHHLLKHIRDHAVQCGREPDEITLIGVTKNHPWEHVHPAYQAGCRDFGENKVQEALSKMEEAADDLRWHLIGTLQKNKVRKVIGKFALIHSVDSVDLAKKLSECSVEAGVTTAILLEVNSSGEASKHGFSLDEVEEAYQRVKMFPNLDVQGLMTMAPFTKDEHVIRSCFRSLRELRDAYGFKHLSMGMSNDYPIAIEEGATLLRIGTQIFGVRELAM
ncbi:MAG: YggS family pyridoxal phosphate-dependent enzyme [Chlamydiales bacterium]|nr:YggS family pyridoxal phosphate-dependent enzyme [Chlamydiales bacterium]